MIDAQNPSDQSADRVLAEQVVRCLWVGYNNTCLYGPSHPLTIRSVEELDKALHVALDAIPMLTMHIEHDAVVCREWQIDRRACGPRLIRRFNDAQIQSLTFYPDIEIADLHNLLAVLSRSGQFPVLESIVDELKRRSIKGFQFNYVIYQKVTLDESIVQKDLHELARLLARSGLRDDSLSQEMLPDSTDVRRESGSKLFLRLKSIREKVGDPSLQPLPSTEELVSVLVSLRNSVNEELHLSGGHEGSGEGIDDTATEMENLTSEVLLRIVREEYRARNLTAQGMAMLIKRLIPDPRDLKRLLPRLKQTLLEEGMRLEEYLELVRNLGRELESDGVMNVLAEAGTDLGVDPEEVVAELRKDPTTAVSLILLAAEIRSAGFRDEDRFSQTLRNYIDRICSELDPSGNRDGDENSRSARLAMRALEEEFSAQLQGRDMPLSAREQALSLWPASEDPATGMTLDPAALPGKLATLEPDDPALEQAGVLTRALAERGFGEKDIARFLLLAEEMGAELDESLESTLELMTELLDRLHEIPDRPAMSDGSFDTGQLAEVVAGIESQISDLFTERGLASAHAPDAIRQIAAALGKIVTGTDAPLESDTGQPDAELSEDLQVRTSIGKPKLDKAILRPKETRSHIEREIARCARYGCAFSCISIAAAGILSDEGCRAIDEREMIPFANAVAERLQSMLRTPDIIGTVGSVSKNQLVVLLPMTDEEGAALAESRFRQALDGVRIEAVQGRVPVDMAMSISAFAGSRAIKTSSFMRRLRSDCQAALDSRPLPGA